MWVINGICHMNWCHSQWFPSYVVRRAYIVWDLIQKHTQIAQREKKCRNFKWRFILPLRIFIACLFSKRKLPVKSFFHAFPRRRKNREIAGENKLHSLSSHTLRHPGNIWMHRNGGHIKMEIVWMWTISMGMCHFKYYYDSNLYAVLYSTRVKCSPAYNTK